MRLLVVGVLVGTPGSEMRTSADSADNSILHMKCSQRCYSSAHDRLLLLLLNGTVLLHTNLHNHEHYFTEYILASEVCNSLVSASRKSERLDMSLHA